MTSAAVGVGALALEELRALPPSPTVLGLLAAFDGPVPPTQLELAAPCTVDELVAVGRLVSAASTGFRRAVICGALGRGSATSAPIVAAFEQIVRGLPEELGHLSLTNNDLGASGATAIAPALQRLTALQTLDLRDNDVAAEGMKALAPALGSLTSLRELRLRGTVLRGTAMTALGTSLEHLPALQVLELTYADMDAEATAALASALRSLPALETLELANNAFGPAGMTSLAPALEGTIRLQALNLCNCKIGAEGAAALVTALGRTPVLQSLKLYGNGIGEAGAVALAIALKDLNNLQYINLWGNDIGPAGAIALAPALADLPGLGFLEVRNNSIGPEGEAALAGVLRSLRPDGPGAQSGLDPATGGTSVDGLDGSEQATLLYVGDASHDVLLSAHSLMGRRSRRAAALLDLMLSPADLSESWSHSLEALLEEETVQLERDLAEIRADTADTHRERLDTQATWQAMAEALLSIPQTLDGIAPLPVDVTEAVVALRNALAKVAWVSASDGPRDSGATSDMDGSAGCSVSAAGGGASGDPATDGLRPLEAPSTRLERVCQLFDTLDASLMDVMSALCKRKDGLDALESDLKSEVHASYSALASAVTAFTEAGTQEQERDLAALADTAASSDLVLACMADGLRSMDACVRSLGGE